MRENGRYVAYTSEGFIGLEALESAGLGAAAIELLPMPTLSRDSKEVSRILPILNCARNSFVRCAGIQLTMAVATTDDPARASATSRRSVLRSPHITKRALFNLMMGSRGIKLIA